ncbi:MAG: aminotransferase class V-fold PLP-dependent enzyme [Candidatus Schekmanbacteria bacterium]|nr:aminotransferase class V-fold PLP-dependent enzyme [Candidatus Schekmanbacteria bacterium]
MKEVYLDNNASAPPLEEVCVAVHTAMREGFGNPSSAHGRGREARRELELARERVAAFLGAETHQIVFTSGGTEGNATVMGGMLRGGVAGRLVTTVVEHASILRPAEALARTGVDVSFVPVDGDGLVDCDQVEETIGDSRACVYTHTHTHTAPFCPVGLR